MRIALLPYILMIFVPQQEAHLWTSAASHEDGSTFLSIDDVRTSQEAQASTAC
jgi:hypothetical protein